MWLYDGCTLRVRVRVVFALTCPLRAARLFLQHANHGVRSCVQVGCRSAAGANLEFESLGLDSRAACCHREQMAANSRIGSAGSIAAYSASFQHLGHLLGCGVCW